MKRKTRFMALTSYSFKYFDWKRKSFIDHNLGIIFLLCRIMWVLEPDFSDLQMRILYVT